MQVGHRPVESGTIMDQSEGSIPLPNSNFMMSNYMQFSAEE